MEKRNVSRCDRCTFNLFNLTIRFKACEALKAEQTQAWKHQPRLPGDSFTTECYETRGPLTSFSLSHSLILACPCRSAVYYFFVFSLSDCFSVEGWSLKTPCGWGGLYCSAASVWLVKCSKGSKYLLLFFFFYVFHFRYDSECSQRQSVWLWSDLSIM